MLISFSFPFMYFIFASVQVPVVATVIQRVGENGQLTISVESPGPEQSGGN